MAHFQTAHFIILPALRVKVRLSLQHIKFWGGRYLLTRLTCLWCGLNFSCYVGREQQTDEGFSGTCTCPLPPLWPAAHQLLICWKKTGSSSSSCLFPAAYGGEAEGKKSCHCTSFPSATEGRGELLLPKGNRRSVREGEEHSLLRPACFEQDWSRARNAASELQVRGQALDHHIASVQGGSKHIGKVGKNWWSFLQHQSFNQPCNNAYFWNKTHINPKLGASYKLHLHGLKIWCHLFPYTGF